MSTTIFSNAHEKSMPPKKPVDCESQTRF
jgi:hypothetical protein